MAYMANANRYEIMKYNRCGRSGLKLPALSLGLWHNFGDGACMDTMKEIIYTSFDNGITHFDLANNYGPKPGAAEENFGRILKDGLKSYRDEIVISTKAGYTMWDGPYGDFGSRKYLLSSLDQSLKRMGLEYVDIFYHHREDPETPLEETMLALDSAVKQGKALYVGVSNYSPQKTEEAYKILKELKTPFIIHQPRYSMLNRTIEDNGLMAYAKKAGIGIIVYSPLAQGLLTGKYLKGIPADSRIASSSVFLNESALTPELMQKISALNEIAEQRGQTLSQMAISWILKDDSITSVLIGASKASQILENVKALKNTDFSAEEIEKIDKITR
ncbi:MAG: L-glyceraldehyde 3-phosphate reductase [Oscillospiraceae bacterium]|nr:L-glyceraldehyde 3-phosphate reductase [Oscillospiraceae bacterium]